MVAPGTLPAFLPCILPTLYTYLVPAYQDHRVTETSSFSLEKSITVLPKLPKVKEDYRAIPYTAHWAKIYPWLCLSLGNRNKYDELKKQAIHLDY